MTVSQSAFERAIRQQSDIERQQNLSLYGLPSNPAAAMIDNVPVGVYQIRLGHMKCQQDISEERLGIIDSETMLIGFGESDNGELGIQGEQHPPKRLKGPSNVQRIRSIAVGAQHCAFTTHDGRVFTFGSNDNGQLGRDTGYKEIAVYNDEDNDLNLLDDSELTPEQKERQAFLEKKIEELGEKNAKREAECHEVRGFTTSTGKREDDQIMKVAAGLGTFSLCLSASGNVYFFGAYKDITGSTTFCHSEGIGRDMTPVHIRLPNKATSIVAGKNTCYAILQDGTCYSWGFADLGQGGNGNVEVFKIDEVTGTLAYNNELLCDGGVEGKYNANLVMKHIMVPRPFKFNVASKHRVISVSATNHVLASVEDSSGFPRLYSAGANGDCQLGHGDRRFRYEMTLVESLKKIPIVKVAAGSDFSLASHIAGFPVYGWGSNKDHRLGLGLDINEKTGKENQTIKDPTPIAFPEKSMPLVVSELVAGDVNAFVRTAENEIYTWGSSLSGQCGWITEALLPRPTKLDLQAKLGGEKLKFHAIKGSGHTLVLASKI